MIKTIFWDMDGTLLSTINDFWSHTFYKSVIFEGYTGNYESIYKIVNETKLFSWLYPERTYPDRTGSLWWSDLADGLVPHLSELGMPEENARRAVDKLRTFVLEIWNYKAYFDVYDVLQYTKNKGYENILVSNNYPEANLVLEKFDLAKYFDKFIISANVGYEKPRREIFEIALDGRNPDECIMIGDNPISDIEGAYNLGIHTILVHRDVESKAEYTCHTLTKIKSIL